jgi:hypothetical protein
MHSGFDLLDQKRCKSPSSVAGLQGIPGSIQVNHAMQSLSTGTPKRHRTPPRRKVEDSTRRRLRRAVEKRAGVARGVQLEEPVTGGLEERRGRGLAGGHALCDPGSEREALLLGLPLFMEPTE